MVLGDLDDGAQRLVLVLCLPLIDGVFATLLVTGAVETFSNIVVVSLTIFTGAGALAVLYAHSDSRVEARKMVRQAAFVLVAGAIVVALVAPVFKDLFYVERLRYAAALVVMVIAAKFLDVRYAEKFSTHGILLTGFVLSVKNPSALTFSLDYVGPAVFTALIAAGALYAAASMDPERITLSYMRKGGAIVLVLIALSLFGLNIPSEITLGVFGTSVAAALK